jgi:hypothetical protein
MASVSDEDIMAVPGDMLLTHGSIVLLYEVGTRPRGRGYDYASMLQTAHDSASLRKLGDKVRYGTQGSAIIEHSAVRWLWRERT